MTTQMQMYTEESSRYLVRSRGAQNEATWYLLFIGEAACPRPYREELEDKRY